MLYDGLLQKYLVGVIENVAHIYVRDHTDQNVKFTNVSFLDGSLFSRFNGAWTLVLSCCCISYPMMFSKSKLLKLWNSEQEDRLKFKLFKNETLSIDGVHRMG